jgi:hypothetical protein
MPATLEPAVKEEAPGIVNYARFPTRNASCDIFTVAAGPKHKIHRHPQEAREGYRETKTAGITGKFWEDDLRDIDHRGIITVLR